MGNFRDAEKFAKQSLNLGKKKYGPHSPKLDWDYYFLAHAYFAQGRFNDAEPLVKARLRKNRKRYPKNHPKIAHSLNNLATIYIAIKANTLHRKNCKKKAIRIRRWLLVRIMNLRLPV